MFAKGGLSRSLPTLKPLRRSIGDYLVRFHLQFWCRTLTDWSAAIVEGDARGAFRTLENAWSKLRTDLILNHELFRIEAHAVRARTALRCALGAGSDRQRMLRVADRDVARIDKEDVPWAKGLALSLRAALTSIRGNMDQACRQLADAEPLLASAHLELELAASRRARGQLLGGDEGRALFDQARAWFESQEMRDPGHICGIYLPGQWDR